MFNLVNGLNHVRYNNSVNFIQNTLFIKCDDNYQLRDIHEETFSKSSYVLSLVQTPSYVLSNDSMTDTVFRTECSIYMLLKERKSAFRGL